MSKEFKNKNIAKKARSKKIFTRKVNENAKYKNYLKFILPLNRGFKAPLTKSRRTENSIIAFDNH